MANRKEGMTAIAMRLVHSSAFNNENGSQGKSSYALDAWLPDGPSQKPTPNAVKSTLMGPPGAPKPMRVAASVFALRIAHFSGKHPNRPAMRRMHSNKRAITNG